VSGTGEHFHRKIIDNIVHTYWLRGRRRRLRDTNMLTTAELADQLGIRPRRQAAHPLGGGLPAGTGHCGAGDPGSAPRQSRLVGHHGSLTPSEMLVPLYTFH
jgi:hypothetical protein